MQIGYKSESGTVWLGLATLVLMPLLVPVRLWWVALAVWACVSLYVSRGAHNTARPRFVPPHEYAAAAARAAADDDDDDGVVVMSRDMPVSARPVAVVTGTNSGIGFYTAVGLAAEGYEVVLTCRSATLTRQTAARVRTAAEQHRRAHARDYVNAPEPVRVCGEWALECDDFASVRAFAAAFAANYRDRNVQVLVNNAGCMHTDLVFSRHCPQLEAHFAVNVCGPLLLTELLLPVLARHGGRVVYVASEAHRFPQMELQADGLPAWRRMPWSTWSLSATRYAEAQGDGKGGDGGGCVGGTCVGMVGGRVLQALKELNQGEAGARGVLAARTVRGQFVRYGITKLVNTYHAHAIARRYGTPSSGGEEAHTQPREREAATTTTNGKVTNGGATANGGAPLAASRYSGRVYACSLHPGCVATNISQKLLRCTLVNHIYQYVSLLFLKRWCDGAQTTLHCAMCPRSELALVVPPALRQRLHAASRGSDEDAAKARAAAEAAAVSAYFVECTNKTDRMLLAYGWDVQEAERVVEWCKQLVGLARDDEAGNGAATAPQP